MMRLLLILVPLLMLAGCPILAPPDGCPPHTYACRNGRPYVCSPTQRWAEATRATCADLGAVCVEGVASVRGRVIATCQLADGGVADAAESDGAQ